MVPWSEIYAKGLPIVDPRGQRPKLMGIYFLWWFSWETCNPGTYVVSHLSSPQKWRVHRKVIGLVIVVLTVLIEQHLFGKDLLQVVCFLEWLEFYGRLTFVAEESWVALLLIHSTSMKTSATNEHLLVYPCTFIPTSWRMHLFWSCLLLRCLPLPHNYAH